MISAIQRCCVNDGPGIRTVVFFQGCHLNCLWCHNPEMIPLEQTKFVMKDKITISGREISEEDLLKLICRDKDYYDESNGGVTFSGGDPLVQADFLMKLIDLCKNNDIHTAVETSCYAPETVFQKVYDRVDLMLADIKIMEPVLFRKYCGGNLEIIVKNLDYALSKEKSIIIRLPLIPKINLNEVHAKQVIQFLSNRIATISIEILPYHKMGEAKNQALGREYYKLTEEAKEDKVFTVAMFSQMLTDAGLHVKKENI